MTAANPKAAWAAEGLEKRAPVRFEPWQLFYWEAWGALRYDRAYIGMDGIETPIPFTAIDAYASRYDIRNESFDLLLRLVSAVDFTFLKVRSEIREQMRKRGSTS